MSEIIDNTWNKAPEKLPGAGGVLTTGILSIIFGFGLVGLILGIVTLTNANKQMQLYYNDPERYDVNSFNRVKNGKTCGIIGLSMFGLGILIALIVLGLG